MRHNDRGFFGVQARYGVGRAGKAEAVARACLQRESPRSGVGLERLPPKADASSVGAAVVDRPQYGSSGSRKRRLHCRRLPAAPLGRGETRRPLRVGRAMKRDADKDARRRTGSKHKRAAMKKPAGEDDEKPAHTAAPKDEFNKLEQQYDSASIEERDRLHPDFFQAIRRKHPGLVEETWRALRNGDSLKATLRHSMKRLLDRHDLSVGRKTNAREDADAAMWLLGELLRRTLSRRR